MTTPNISLNPFLTTNAAGLFGTSSNGLIQGMAMPDPSARNWLAGGFLPNTETLPMFGGVGISEAVPTPQGSPPVTPNSDLGGPVGRATNIIGGNTPLTMSGFSVFDQNYAAVNTPQSEVPMVGTYGPVLFYRFGSRARIPVAMDAALVSAQGRPISYPVSWDYVNQKLVAYQAAFAANTITAATWAAGIATLTTNTAHGVLPGGIVQVSGISPAGYNGTFVATAGTTASTLKYAVASDPGAYVSGGALAAGGGALPVTILKASTVNNMTVSYDPTTNYATWNRSGAAALILL